MTSRIRYQFVNSTNSPEPLLFSGSSLTLDALKRLIVEREGLGDSGMDLVITDTAGMEFTAGMEIFKDTSVRVKQRAPQERTVRVGASSAAAAAAAAIPGLGSGPAGGGSKLWVGRAGGPDEKTSLCAAAVSMICFVPSSSRACACCAAAACSQSLLRQLLR